MTIRASAGFRRGERGVTLLEVLVASALMLMVMASLYTMMIDSVHAEKTQRNIAEAQQNARLVMQLLSRHSVLVGSGMVVSKGTFPRAMAIQAPFELMTMDHVSKAAGDAGLAQGEMLFGVLYQGSDSPPAPIYPGAAPMDLTNAPSTIDIPVKFPSGLLDSDIGNISLFLYNPIVAKAHLGSANPVASRVESAWDNGTLFTTMDAHVATDVGTTDAADTLTLTVNGADVSEWQPTDVGNSLGTTVFAGVHHVVFAFKNEQFYMADFSGTANGGKAEAVGQFRPFGMQVEMADVRFIFHNDADPITPDWEMTLAGIEADREQWFSDKDSGFLRGARFDIITKTRNKVKAVAQGGNNFVSASYINPEGEYADRIIRVQTTVQFLSFH